MLQPARQSLSCCSRASSPGAPRQPRGKPWPRARSLVGRLRHGWGKPLAGWGEWERDMGISDPAAVLGDSTPVEEPPRGAPRELPESGRGRWGRRVALGVPGALAGAWCPVAMGTALARGGLGGHLHSALLEVAQSRGGPEGVRGPVLGVLAKPPPTASRPGP